MIKQDKIWVERTLAELDLKIVLPEWRKARKRGHFNGVPIWNYVEKKLIEALEMGRKR